MVIKLIVLGIIKIVAAQLSPNIESTDSLVVEIKINDELKSQIQDLSKD